MIGKVRIEDSDRLEIVVELDSKENIYQIMQIACDCNANVETDMDALRISCFSRTSMQMENLFEVLEKSLCN